MVSFVCNVCQETLKKPKLVSHTYRCRGAHFSCIDCNTDFEGDSWKNHTSCISEDQKYQKSLYRGPKGGNIAHHLPSNCTVNSKRDVDTDIQKAKKLKHLDSKAIMVVSKKIAKKIDGSISLGRFVDRVASKLEKRKAKFIEINTLSHSQIVKHLLSKLSVDELLSLC